MRLTRLQWRLLRWTTVLCALLGLINVIRNAQIVHNRPKVLLEGKQEYYTDKKESKGLPDHDVISSKYLYVKENPSVVINVGLERCFYVGRSLWGCHVLNQCNGAMLNRVRDPVTRTRITKDLRGGYNKNNLGIANFVFYDTMNLNAGIDEQLEGVTNVSELDTYNNGFKCEVIHMFDPNLPKDDVRLIEEIDILFGSDSVEPRKNWNIKPFTPKNKLPAFLTIKHQSQEVGQLRSSSVLVSRSDKFKVVQLADLHLGVGKRACIDEFPKHENCEADSKTINFIEAILDIENPDMVVFSGDQIMGDASVLDSLTVLLKAVDPVIRREIPWAMVWGNHDHEGSLSRWELSSVANQLPFSLFQFSAMDTDNNEFGVGNYYHQVFRDEQDAASGSSPLATFYFLDSHAYTRSAKIKGYDWIKESQWNYLKNIYESEIKPKIVTDRVHLSMAFFHIPLPEYMNFQSQKNEGTMNQVIGNFKEGITAPRYNSHGLETLSDLGVRAISCGHDHCNDYCLEDDSTSNKIWLCYGGAAGEGGYAGYGGTERRIRIFELDFQTGSIHTWKRLNGSPSELFDYQQI